MEQVYLLKMQIRNSKISYLLLGYKFRIMRNKQYGQSQVDEYDLKPSNGLKWQVAMISMRIKKFYKKTGRKLQFDAKEHVDGRRTGRKKRLKHCDIDGESVDWTIIRKRANFSDASVEIKAYTQEVQPKVWSDAPIIEEYESDSDDEYVSVQTKGLDTPSFANKQVKTPRENVKNQSTHSQKPKVNNKELGHGFTERACFVCGSFSHLIRDCDYHVKLAKQVELNKQNMSKGNGTGERKPTWNNVQRVNKQNQFVPLAVQTRTGNNPVNTAKASSTKNFSTARQNVNRQTVLTSTALKVNTVKPIVNGVRPANVFHKTHSPSSRPFKRTTVLRTNFSNQKVYTAKVKEVSTVGEKWDTVFSPLQGTMIRNIGFTLLTFKTLMVALLPLEVVKAILQEVWLFNCKATTDEYNNIAYEVGHVKFQTYQNCEGNLVRGLPTKLFSNDTIVLMSERKANTKLIVWPKNQANLHAGQQESNQNTGTKDKIDAGDSEKEDESDQDCFELPIWHSFLVTFIHLLQNMIIREGVQERKKQVFLDDLARLQRHEKGANEESIPVSTASPNEGLSLSDIPIPKKMTLKYSLLRIFLRYYDVVNVSLFHQEFKSLSSYSIIIGDPTSAVQTRSKISKSEDEAGVDAMQEELMKEEWLSGTKLDFSCSGTRQEVGFDYVMVFAPVLGLKHKDLFSICLYMGVIVYKMDVKSAFYMASLMKRYLCLIPPGFLDPKVSCGTVYKVVQSLYGLLQASEHSSVLVLGNHNREVSISCAGDSITWHAISKTIMATSTKEVEYVAAASCFIVLNVGYTFVNIRLQKQFGNLMFALPERVGRCSRSIAVVLDPPRGRVYVMLDNKGMSNKWSNVCHVNWMRVFLRKTILLNNITILAPTSEVPNESLPDSSSAQPKPTGENLGDHSSNDASLSGNEDDMTLQFTSSRKQAKLTSNITKKYDGVIIAAKIPKEELSKKHRVHKESVSKQGRKKAKEESSVQRDPLFDVMHEDKIDHMETEMLYTEESKVSTDEQVEGTEESNESTEEIFEGTEEQRKGTDEKVESTAGKIKKNSRRVGSRRRKKQGAEEEATNEALIKNFDDIKARIEADRILAEKLQEQEREQFTIEERAKFLHDTIAAQRKFLAQQRSEAIRNRPPTKNQLRNQMMTYLKHVGNFKHSELKSKKFEDIQAMYEKIKRSTEDFIAIGSVEDESLIKRMNKKDSSKEEEIKQESKEEVKQEDKEEENSRKRKHGTRKKMKSRKRRYIQHTSEDDTDKENDELRLCLTIAPDEDKEVDYEVLDKKYPIIDWKTQNFGTKPQLDESKRSEEINLNVVTRSNGQKRFFSTLMTVLSVFDREDLDAVYKLVMDIYQDKIPEGFDKVLWGDLIVMFNPEEQDEFWNSQHEWNIVSWKLHSSSGVHTLMTDEGLVIHMLIEKKYPLKMEILVQMLKLKLESEEESTMALELIRFIKKILADLESKE
ncbi:ribonuclease H-like domain-containing protein [Tanacetum coccineum]